MGGGWCFYSVSNYLMKDIPIAIKHLVMNKRIKKALIIDLDNHQGNGMERDKLENLITKKENIMIIDVYAVGYPNDGYAKKGIDIKRELPRGISDRRYLKIVKNTLDNFKKNNFKADIIFYNAGTDIYQKDPLGSMNISKDGIMKRDEIIFKFAFDNNIPISMVLSGNF
jgi:histone deacetylase 11